MKFYPKYGFFTFLVLFITFFIYWELTQPTRVLTFSGEDGEQNLKNGKEIFTSAGCLSCHNASKSKPNTTAILSGGKQFETPFGVFYAPNISFDLKSGIGSWSEDEFINALKNGVSPNGEHYFPVFPYSSFKNLTNQDIRDLRTFLKTLPPSAVENKPHQIKFPYSMRRNIGLWKVINSFNDQDKVDTDNRGEYLVKAVVHCGECHTPRNFLGIPQKSKFLKGSKNFNLKESAPDITPEATGIGDWSREEIVLYLKTGLTPEFDAAGGSMVDIIENLSVLKDTDYYAIADYLKSLTKYQK